MKKNRIFSDLDFGFNVHPVKKELILSYDEQAILRALRNLILTNHYDIPFEPEFGSNVRKMLFEPISNITSDILKREIFNTISNYEKRVKVSDITIELNSQNDSYHVFIEFYIENQIEPLVVDFELNRLR
jgi:phage baseplate assembly protein W